MNDIKSFIGESLEVIKKRAYENQLQEVLFVGLCNMLKLLDEIAQQEIPKDDSLFEEIDTLKKILCKNE